MGLSTQERHVNVLESPKQLFLWSDPARITVLQWKENDNICQLSALKEYLGSGLYRPDYSLHYDVGSTKWGLPA